MRMTKSFAVAASTLMLATGAAFAGEDALTDRSDPMGYQPYAVQWYEGGPEYQYFAQPQGYEVYEVYLVPAEEIVLIPLDPSEVPISGNERG